MASTTVLVKEVRGVRVYATGLSVVEAVRFVMARAKADPEVTLFVRDDAGNVLAAASDGEVEVF